MPEVYILNVWDSEQNKYVGIPAIKGDKGDKGDTPVIPIATESTPGLLKPVTKTDKMRLPVGVDVDGRLYVESNYGPWRHLGKFITTEDVDLFEVNADSSGAGFSLKNVRMVIVTNPPENPTHEGSDAPNATCFEVWLDDSADGETSKGNAGKGDPDNYNKSLNYDLRHEIDYWSGNPITGVRFVKQSPKKWGGGVWAGNYQHFCIGKGTYIELWGIDA